MIKSRKASLELSVNAIVIIVLAMTLLGLGLFFIRGLFGNVIELSESTFSKISDEVSQRLSTGQDKLLFSSIQFDLERGKSKLEGFGIKNIQNAEMKFGVLFYPVSCPGDGQTESTKNKYCRPYKIGTDLALEPWDKGTIDEWFTYVKGPKSYTIGGGQQFVKRVEVKIPGDAPTGLYLVKMIVYTGDNAQVTSGGLSSFATVPSLIFDTTSMSIKGDSLTRPVRKLYYWIAGESPGRVRGYQINCVTSPIQYLTSVQVLGGQTTEMSIDATSLGDCTIYDSTEIFLTVT
ncbi:MAG: hypothetical protein V1740_06445 [Candidatus Woesearchaeota archaeon]